MLINIGQTNLPARKRERERNPLPGFYTCRHTCADSPIRRKLRVICAKIKSKWTGTTRIRKGSLAFSRQGGCTLRVANFLPSFFAVSLSPLLSFSLFSLIFRVLLPQYISSLSSSLSRTRRLAL